MDKLTESILLLLEVNSLSTAEIVDNLEGDLPSGKSARKVIGGALSWLTRRGLVVAQDNGTWKIVSNVPVPERKDKVKELPNTIRPYVVDRDGLRVLLHSDPKTFRNVVAIEFSIDGRNFYPVHVSSDAMIHVGKIVPDWNEDMDIYRDIAAYRIFYKGDKKIEVYSEDVSGFGWHLVIVEER